MKDIRDFFDTEMQATKQSAGVSFSRTNARPLDSTSVFETFEAASSYAKLSATSYPGQIVAVYDSTLSSMDAYVLDPLSDTGLKKLASGASAEELLEKINKEKSDRISVDTILSNAITSINEVAIPELSGNLMDSLSVTLESESKTEGDILKTYTIKQGGQEIGTIDIPRDFLVTSASVKTCETQDTPVEGYKVGDKYIDFLLNTKEGKGEERHLYVLVSDLVDNYTGGSTSTISVGIVDNVVCANVLAGSITRDLLASDVKGELKVLSDAIDANAGNIASNLEKINTISTDLGEEVARAIAKENEISTKLDNAITAYQNKDTELQKSIEDEVQRATLAEQANATAISNEETARKAADKALEDKITAEETRAKGEESTLSTLIITEKSVRESADETLQLNIDNLSTSVNSKIESETVRAKAAESLLSTRIDAADALIAANSQNITKNANDITSEANRAKGVEAGLSERIDNLSTDLGNYATKTELGTETEARKSADSGLQSQITTISSDYLKSADKTALESKITAEETRAKGIEGELSVKIDRAIDDLSNTYETKADATTKYNELTGLIDAEEGARVSADEELKKNLSVTVEALAEAEGDYLKTYVVKQGGVQVGAKINIPKDFVIKNASVKTCTENNKPVEGLNVGDKYIDLEVNVTEGTVTSTHLYLPIKDMVDAYEGGTTTTVKVEIGSNNEISASVIDGSISYVKLSSDVTDKFDTIDGTLTGLRTDVNTISTDLGNEVTRAIAKENEISGKLDGEVERAKNVEDTLSAEISSKIFIKDPNSETYKDGAYGNLSVLKVTEEEYMEKVADGTLLNDGVLYVISSDHINAYGQKIVNLAEPTVSSDAATKNYVDTTVSESKLTAIELNNLSFTIENNKASLNIDVISCGNAN